MRKLKVAWATNPFPLLGVLKDPQASYQDFLDVTGRGNARPKQRKAKPTVTNKQSMPCNCDICVKHRAAWHV